MQRSIKISTAAASALLLFAGCGGGDSTPASSPGASPADTDTVTVQCPADAATCITVWVDETRQGPVADAAQTYMAANSGVGFEIVQKNYDDIRADFIQQVPTGQGPDITVGANDWTGELVQAGVVAPVTLQNTSDYEEVAINAFTFDGQLYAVPYAIENIALIRNTDLAPDAPATWDDAIAAAEAAGTEHKVLIQTGDQGDPYTYYPLQTSFGAPVFESDGQGGYSTTVGMGGEPGHNYAAWLQQQGSAGNLSTSVTYDIAVAAFAAKEAPFIIGGPWMISSFEGINL
ncbi:MAG: extracellular solute-binding protein, partial [Cellulomonadaceae bacterium]|nr:extracellular solute-binding protein [Cellulomonadaceae bacterium]